MKTAQTISRNLTSRPSKSRCILDLERNNKDLQHLEKQVSYYIYEPNTYSSFIKSQSIRQALASLKKTNAELIAALKKERDLKIEHFEKTISQIRSFEKIQNSVDEYCRQLRH